MTQQEEQIKNYIKLALCEDIGEGDHTSLACVPEKAAGTAFIYAKESGVIAGLQVAAMVFAEIDPQIEFQCFFKDGDLIDQGDRVCLISGNSRSILKGERLALNFLQRMSGIATKTRRFNEKLKGMHAQLLDTRKTTPNNRIFEKMAVAAGGACNHRFGLYDMIMIKDNHIDFSGGIKPAIDRVCQYKQSKNLERKVEIEVRNFTELEIVLQRGGVDRIMLDNFSVQDLSKAVKMIQGRFETEASGGINENTMLAYAATGVDYLSMGALTHQIASLDLSLVAENINKE